MDLDAILDDSNVQDVGSGMIITPAIRDHLAVAARWSKFIAIVSFVFIGLYLVIMLFGGSALMMSGLPGEAAGMGGAFMVFYLIIMGISLIPIVYMYNFATKTQQALQNDHQAVLEDAFKNLKSMYKFYGILMSVFLGLMVLGFLIGLVGGLASAL